MTIKHLLASFQVKDSIQIIDSSLTFMKCRGLAGLDKMVSEKLWTTRYLVVLLIKDQIAGLWQRR